MHSKICAIAQQGLEFWCTISGNSYCLAVFLSYNHPSILIHFSEIEYDLASGKYDPSDIIPVIRHFSKTNLPKLLPALFNVVVWWQLSSSDDIEDFDDWSPYKAAILCITFLSKSCSDSIHSYILPLITPKLKVCKCYDFCANFLKTHILFVLHSRVPIGEGMLPQLCF